MLTALGEHTLARAWFAGIVGGFLQRLFFKLAAMPVSMFALFLVYWLLPNRKIEPARVAPVAIVVGLILEGLKYLNMLFANVIHEKLDREYKIFEYSVTILLWSFVAALVVLAGAHWTAAPRYRRSAIVESAMKDWTAIAKAAGPDIPAKRPGPRSPQPLNALDEVFPAAGARPDARYGTGRRFPCGRGAGVTIREAAEALRQRRFSAVELTSAALGRIERSNPTLQAFITVTAEQALQQARQADAELAAGRDRGPLHGIPMAVKDLFLYARRPHHRRLADLPRTSFPITMPSWWRGWKPPAR